MFDSCLCHKVIVVSGFFLSCFKSLSLSLVSSCIRLMYYDAIQHWIWFLTGRTSVGFVTNDKIIILSYQLSNLQNKGTFQLLSLWHTSRYSSIGKVTGNGLGDWDSNPDRDSCVFVTTSKLTLESTRSSTSESRISSLWGSKHVITTQTLHLISLMLEIVRFSKTWVQFYRRNSFSSTEVLRD